MSQCCKWNYPLARSSCNKWLTSDINNLLLIGTFPDRTVKLSHSSYDRPVSSWESDINILQRLRSLQDRWCIELKAHINISAE